jgi:hypothetical protein
MHPLTIVPVLQAGITDEQRAEWLASDAVAWANESFAIARKPEFGYRVMVGDTCQHAADNRAFAEGKGDRGRRRLSGQARGGRAGTDREGGGSVGRPT